jgi:hypothetical protein
MKRRPPIFTPRGLVVAWALALLAVVCVGALVWEAWPQ